MARSRRSDVVPICQSLGKTQALPRAECSLRCSSTFLLTGLGAVHVACPGVSLMGNWDSRFAGQLYADDLVVVADSAADLQTGLDAVSTWGFRHRFTFGVGPSKSATMIFGPRRNLSACNVTLGGIALPVSEYKCLGVVLSPTLSWAAHVQHVVNRSNRLFAQCVSWC